MYLLKYKFTVNDFYFSFILSLGIRLISLQKFCADRVYHLCISFQNGIECVIKYLVHKGDTGSERVGIHGFRETAAVSSETFSNTSVKS